MIVTAVWVALAAAAVLLDVLARSGRAPWPTLGRIGSSMAATRRHRVLLVLVWGYVGWHLFTRYTIPR
ncbi:MAG TPA: DUF6186 family protein [Acidimicrobiales bacterium]|nr:DUF6186 family protein [Acidimicrobiales bacterium]